MTNSTIADPVRQCGDCGLCCKLLAVDEIDKIAHRWCDHFVPGSGCAIYNDRPLACSTFQCIWLRQTELSAEWKPNRAHFVMYLDARQKQLVVKVDPVHPNAWRKEPYLSEFRLWARRSLDQGPQLVVKIRRRIIAILPDREIDFGVLADDERIRLTRHQTPDGVGLSAQKVSVGD